MSGNITLTVNWSNGQGFDNVQKLRISRVFREDSSNPDIVNKDFSRDNDTHTNYFANGATGLSTTFSLTRNSTNEGTHYIKAYYSMDGEEYVYFGGTQIQITAQQLTLDFDTVGSQNIAYAPIQSGFSVEVAASVEELNVKLGSVNIFGGSIGFVSSTGNLLKILYTDTGSNNGKYLKADAAGVPTWEEGYSQGSSFYISEDSDSSKRIAVDGSGTSDALDLILYYENGLKAGGYTDALNKSEITITDA